MTSKDLEHYSHVAWSFMVLFFSIFGGGGGHYELLLYGNSLHKFCSAYGFGTTWGWLKMIEPSFFEWTISLTTCLHFVFISCFLKHHKFKRNGLCTFRASTTKYTMSGSMQKKKKKRKFRTVQLVLRTRKPDLRSAFQQECFSKHSPCKPTVCSKQNTGGVLPTFLKDF